MSDSLQSVGLDVGTTTTQLIVSRLQVENRAGAFSVPQLAITDREVLYQSPVYMTPLQGGKLVDGAALRDLVAKEYEKAGITRETVDTGAVIITGETSRKENARRVLENLSEFAGDFVVATAGPDLESVLAAKGAGAVGYSEATGKRVLHMDIGGGTSNLALVEEGKIVATGCLNVGGRLVKFGPDGHIYYQSPVLEGLCDLQIATKEALKSAAKMLVEALEMAAGLRPETELLDRLWTKENPRRGFPISGTAVISFSGGVADCIENAPDWNAFGDLGPILGKAIGESLLCRGEYRLGEQTIRATVIGAGCHSAQLSGSTVFFRNVGFPLKNLPVVTLTEQEQGSENLPRTVAEKLSRQERDPVLWLPGIPSPNYEQVAILAKALVEGFGSRPVFVALEQDMAKALGQAMALRLNGTAPCLCVDGVRLGEGDYLDVAAPVGPALPVVIKTLVIGEQNG